MVATDDAVKLFALQKPDAGKTDVQMYFSINGKHGGH
jgi:hypothetical protein